MKKGVSVSTKKRCGDFRATGTDSYKKKRTHATPKSSSAYKSPSDDSEALLASL